MLDFNRLYNKEEIEEIFRNNSFCFPYTNENVMPFETFESIAGDGAKTIEQMGKVKKQEFLGETFRYITLNIFMQVISTENMLTYTRKNKDTLKDAKMLFFPERERKTKIEAVKNG